MDAEWPHSASAALSGPLNGRVETELLAASPGGHQKDPGLFQLGLMKVKPPRSKLETERERETILTIFSWDPVQEFNSQARVLFACPDSTITIRDIREKEKARPLKSD